MIDNLGLLIGADTLTKASGYQGRLYTKLTGFYGAIDLGMTTLKDKRQIVNLVKVEKQINNPLGLTSESIIQILEESP